MTTKELHAAMPFAALLGLELVAATPERVEAQLAWRPELCTEAGVLHGGAVMALADSCGGLCAALGLPGDGSATATTGSHVTLLRAVLGGALTATATPLHRGRSSAVIETEVRDDERRLVAKVTQAQAILWPSPAAA